MNVPNRTPIQQQARALRREEISRLLDITASGITDWLRRRHESVLRNKPRSTRMRTANATPA